MLYSLQCVIQSSNFGIDWDGPIGSDDDSTVVFDNVRSPINREQEVALLSLISSMEDDDYFDINDSSWYRQYCAAKEFVVTCS